MGLSAELLTLADRARAEAKARSQEPTAWHIALALARAESETFNEVFGTDVAQLLRTERPRAELPSLDAALSNLADTSTRGDCLRIRELLAAELAALTNGQPATEPKPPADAGTPAATEPAASSTESSRDEQIRAAISAPTRPTHRYAAIADPRPIPASQEAATRELLAHLLVNTEVTPLVALPAGAQGGQLAG